MELDENIEYLCKKLGFSKEEFDRIMDANQVSHFNYPNNQIWFDLTDKLYYIKKFYNYIFGNIEKSSHHII